MNIFLRINLLMLFMLCSFEGHAQYSVSGFLGSEDRNKTIYLSLIGYDESSLIKKEQVLFSTQTDSTGFFRFTGSLLSNKDKLYRIHANVNEKSEGFDIVDLPDRKNFNNFIFSNTDTIHFQKSDAIWFSVLKNTNKTDEAYRAFHNYSQELVSQFVNIKNIEARNQSMFKTLSDIQQYAVSNNIHPLPTLIILNWFSENVLKTDYEKSSDFYLELYNQLHEVYGDDAYIEKYNSLLSRLTISPNEEKLGFHKQLNIFFGFLILTLLGVIVFLMMRLKKQKMNFTHITKIHLTKQEEKVAELIQLEKSNKEIANELFVSLSTVKTHVHNLYNKFEVNNRSDFLTKFKNQPKD